MISKKAIAEAAGDVEFLRSSTDPAPWTTHTMIAAAFQRASAFVAQVEAERQKVAAAKKGGS